ncbi:winged helix-turn-helix domain-containing protein [Edaphobacter aggregans]|uniref:winged helix-turn-helix domain-containing protein n=1 Tax=Edaphobacter aggregans TaxID=570835 RepID=UPI0005542680|nr:winged helix-turn-helix domain-containing protein [Edaphobacter aggregans]
MDEERWQAVLHIVNSPLFSRSSRLSQLLLYLAEQTLLDRTELLNEQNIATEVFARGDDFDPGVDTIVRSHMVRLRQRLDQYAADSQDTVFRVTIPKGEYLVRFDRVVASFRELAEPQTIPQIAARAPSVTGEDTSSRSRWVTNPLFLPCCLMSVLIVFLSFALFSTPYRDRAKTAPNRPTHPLWNRIFQSSRPTTFVAADNGLVLLHWMTRKDTTLTEYLNHDFRQETQGLSRERIDEILNIANRRYTSFVDLNLFRRVQQLPFASPDKLIVKYARDLRMDELKQGNIILSGARGANPWLELYEPQMNFFGSNDGVHHIYSFINRQPQPGEPDRYFVSDSDPKRRVLGVLAFISNLDGNGNALVIEGNSMAGTEAITDFLFNDDALLPFLNQLKRPDGTLPHFEVLIESNSVNGNAGSFHILAYRTHN